MTNRTEKDGNRAEAEREGGHGFAKRSRPLRETFVRQLSLLHGMRSDKALACGFGCEKLVRDIGETWFIDPRYGKGFYWFYPIDDGTVVVSMDVTFSRCVEARMSTAAYLSLGLYEHDMPRYCSPECAESECRVVGNDWRGGRCLSSFAPGMRLTSASIVVTPESARHYADALRCDIGKLRRAIARLASFEGTPGLPSALRGIHIARPSAAAADIYYRAKVIECLALLISGASEESRAGKSAGASNRSCIDCICSYIDGNLSTDLSTKALCGIAHVSAGKLISAFRGITGETPQDYIREQRMEYAKRLLLEETCGIGEIAEAVGYRNQGAFSEAFKRTFGMAPRAYRKNRRAAQPLSAQTVEPVEEALEPLDHAGLHLGVGIRGSEPAGLSRHQAGDSGAAL